MKKLVLEIDLDHIAGNIPGVLELLHGVAQDLLTFPYDDLRESGEDGKLSSRIFPAGEQKISANVVASVDVVDGELSYTNIEADHHEH